MFLVILFLTAVVYLIFPIAYRANTGGINLRTAKKVAFFNSLIVGSIFFIITISLSEDVTWSIVPAITYYHIAKLILISREEKIKENLKSFERKYGINLLELKQGVAEEDGARAKEQLNGCSTDGCLLKEQGVADAKEVKRLNDKLIEDKKKEEVLGRMRIEEDRKFFWGLFTKKLEESGYPFRMKIVHLPNGAPKHYATIKSGNGAQLGVDFLASDGVLRIQLYIDDNTALYERLQNKRTYLESVLGYSLLFQDGKKNKDVKWIKREWTFIPHNKDEYEELILRAFSDMVKFVGLFEMFI